MGPASAIFCPTSCRQNRKHDALGFARDREIGPGTGLEWLRALRTLGGEGHGERVERAPGHDAGVLDRQRPLLEERSGQGRVHGWPAFEIAGRGDDAGRGEAAEITRDVGGPEL